MSLREFMLHRGIRLFPCYWVALALGLVLGTARMIRDNGYSDTAGLIGAAGFNLLMLPSLVSLYGGSNLFPFNGASWSLMYELVANLVYGLIFRLLTARNLLILVIVSAVGFVFAGRYVGTVDMGMRGGEAIPTLGRVLFSFFAGVALRRHVHERLRIQLGPTGATVAIAVLVVTLCVANFTPERLVGEFIAIFLVFPLLIVFVSNTVPGPKLSLLCRVAGNTSYPVYILQTPMMLLFAAVPEVFFHTKAREWAPLYGVLEVTAIVACAWWVDARIELPARKALKNWLLPKRRALNPA
jgi:peptidoglycan/LPS O-acetylase OafA/YrhL